MKRRKFIGLSAMAGAATFLQAHSCIHSAADQVKPGIVNKEPLIKSLRLLTHAQLTSLKKFYCELIGFTLISESENNLSIRAGLTEINFVKDNSSASRPFYHFAFNIPENKMDKAFEWQRKKTTIIHPNPTGPTDSITHFSHWNAHSIFFLDPAGNLVEYIARHDLKNKAEGEFSVKDILYASEIGFIVNDVSVSGNELIKGLNISEYRPLTNDFWPIGDEHGLLLMIKKGREWRARESEKNITDVFKTSVSINNKHNTGWSVPGYPYEIF